MSQKIEPSCGLSLSGEPNSVVALFVDGVLEVATVNLLLVTCRFAIAFLSPVITVFEVNAVLEPLNVALADTVKIPLMLVLAGMSPNRFLIVIFFDTGVPFGSVINSIKSTLEGLEVSVRALTLESAMLLFFLV